MDDSNGDGDFNFDLEPQEKRFRYRGKWYLLREASADAMLKYRMALLRSNKELPSADSLRAVAAGQEAPARDTVEIALAVHSSELVLVANCLYLADEGGKVPIIPPGVYDPQRLVGEAFVRFLPDHVRAALLKWIEQHSDCLQDRGGASKKEPATTEPTSQ